MNARVELKHRMMEGSLDPVKVSLAAALGSLPAIAIGVVPTELPGHYRTRMEKVVSSLTRLQCVELACECAERCLSVWETQFPADSRPENACVAVRAWLLDRASLADFQLLSDQAAQAGTDVGYPELREDIDPLLCAAIYAADAASHAALTVKYFMDNEPREDLFRVVAWTARFGKKAAADAVAEIHWQTQRLISLLLE